MAKKAKPTRRPKPKPKPEPQPAPEPEKELQPTGYGIPPRGESPPPWAAKESR